MKTLYLENLTLKELHDRAEELDALLDPCQLCPHNCNAERKQGKTGVCNAADKLVVSSAGPHYGEEPPISGRMGSGTIFMAHCNLSCIFCQNYDISHEAFGAEISINDLAVLMLKLQNRGSHNVNFVTPTHYTPHIVKALAIAVEKGFELPVVYNCGGYESLEILKLLDGIIDIYMPDIKYGDDDAAAKYSGIHRYTKHAFAALREMHRQTGNLKTSHSGIAQRGLLVRHLVMPNGLAASKKVIDFIASDISKDTYLNIMDQYRPAFKAHMHPELARSIGEEEFSEIIMYAKEAGLHRGFEWD
jgi:putative pyruvate formate lyase activating enzyme